MKANKKLSKFVLVVRMFALIVAIITLGGCLSSGGGYTNRVDYYQPAYERRQVIYNEDGQIIWKGPPVLVRAPGNIAPRQVYIDDGSNGYVPYPAEGSRYYRQNGRHSQPQVFQVPSQTHIEAGGEAGVHWGN